MSARGLRLLISVMVVFGIFVYVLSSQMNTLVPVKSPDEGLLGGPIPGLTKWQLEKFKEGKQLFAKNFSVQEGLGPLYNGSSCIECHSEPLIKADNSVSGEAAQVVASVNESAKKSSSAPAGDNREDGAATTPGARGETAKLETGKTKSGSESSMASKTAGATAEQKTAEGKPEGEKGSAGNSKKSKAAETNSSGLKALSTKSDGTKTDKKGKSAAGAGVGATAKTAKDGSETSKTPDGTATESGAKHVDLNLTSNFPEYNRQTVFLVAKRDAKGRYASEPVSALLSKAELKDLDRMIRSGGPIMVRNSISSAGLGGVPADCKIDGAKKAPEGTEFMSRRVAHQLYGLGYVDSVADGALNYNAARQRMLRKGVHGRAVGLQRTYFITSTFGRFGSKAQFSSVFNCVGNELGAQLGISNPLFPHTLAPTGLDAEPPCFKTLAASPNDKGAALLKINFYLLTSAPPPRGPRNQQVEKGERLFSKMGCAVCHMPEMRTPDKVMVMNPDADVEDAFASIHDAPPFEPTEQNRFGVMNEPKSIELRALEKKPFYPYSDFLVHDMGPGLADGFAQNGTTGGEWKTPALWGLRHRKVYLHDGSVRTLDAAIKAHGGEGQAALSEYNKLTDAERESLHAFLQSL